MFKRIVIGAIIAFVGFGSAVAGDHYVRGYTRKDGTYVAPHYQTNPNSTTSDNYSTRGNVNPYTGKPGTKPDTRPAYGSSAPSPYGSSRPTTTSCTQLSPC